MLLRNRFVTEGGVPSAIPKGHVPHPTIGPVCFAVLQNLHTSSDHTLRDASFANNIGLECRLSKGPACRREFNSSKSGIFSGPGVSGGPAGRPPEAAFAEEKEEALQGKLDVQGLGG